MTNLVASRCPSVFLDSLGVQSVPYCAIELNETVTKVVAIHLEALPPTIAIATVGTGGWWAVGGRVFGEWLAPESYV